MNIARHVAAIAGIATALTAPWAAYSIQPTLPNGFAAMAIDLLAVGAFVGAVQRRTDTTPAEPDADIHHFEWNDDGPTDAELAAIEAEGPILAAELAAVDAECTYLLAPNDITERQWRNAETEAETLRTAAPVQTRIGA